MPRHRKPPHLLERCVGVFLSGALRCLHSLPPSPHYSLLGFRVFLRNPSGTLLPQSLPLLNRSARTSAPWGAMGNDVARVPERHGAQWGTTLRESQSAMGRNGERRCASERHGAQWGTTLRECHSGAEWGTTLRELQSAMGLNGERRCASTRAIPGNARR